MFLSSFDITPFFPNKESVIKFDVLSIVYLVIIVIAILLGIKRGFLKSLISALGGIVVLVAAFLLAKPIGNALFNSSSLHDGIFNGVLEWLLQKSPDLSVEITAATAPEAIPVALGHISSIMPAALINTISGFIIKFVPAEGSISAGAVIAQGITNFSLIAGSFLVLCIVFTIVLVILKHVIKALTELPVIKGVDKLLGSILGFVVGCCVICFVSYGLTFLTSIPKCNEFLNNTMHISDPSVWTFSKMIYDYNLIGKLFELYLAK